MATGLRPPAIPPSARGQQNTRDRAALSPQEYLDQSGVTAYLKDATTLLLENRPKSAVNFLSEYFKNVIAGSSPHLRSYRYLRLSKRGRAEFIDNLAAAYQTLDSRQERDGEKPGVTVQDCISLARMICTDLPPNIITLLSVVLNKKDTSIVTFGEFSAAVSACLVYEELEKCKFSSSFEFVELLEEMRGLFSRLRLAEGGKSLRVRKEDLLQLLEHVAKQDAMDEQTRARSMSFRQLEVLARKIKEFPCVEEDRMGQQDFISVILEATALPTAEAQSEKFLEKQCRDLLLSL